MTSQEIFGIIYGVLILIYCINYYKIERDLKRDLKKIDDEYNKKKYW